MSEPLEVFLWCLGMLNLLLVLFVIRALRKQAGRLDQLPWWRWQKQPLPRPVEEFRATTAAGQALTRQDLLGRRHIVAFLTPGCSLCEIQLPIFKALAAKAGPTAGVRFLGVVLGDGAPAARLGGELSGVVDVVVEKHDSSLTQAFGAALYPVFHLLDDAATIQAEEHEVAAIVARLRAFASAS
jgi:thiol-disulfide isomerase/thioredoxin